MNTVRVMVTTKQVKGSGLVGGFFLHHVKGLSDALDLAEKVATLLGERVLAQELHEANWGGTGLVLGDRTLAWESVGTLITIDREGGRA